MIFIVFENKEYEHSFIFLTSEWSSPIIYSCQSTQNFQRLTFLGIPSIFHLIYFCLTRPNPESEAEQTSFTSYSQLLNFWWDRFYQITNNSRKYMHCYYKYLTNWSTLLWFPFFLTGDLDLIVSLFSLLNYFLRPLDQSFPHSI